MSLPVFPALSVPPEYPIKPVPVFDTSITTGDNPKVEQREANRSVKLRFSFKYRLINNNDRRLLNDFWNARRGGYEKWTWTNPETGTEYTVKFKMKEIGLNYYRFGLWNTDEIILQTV